MAIVTLPDVPRSLNDTPKRVVGLLRETTKVHTSNKVDFHYGFANVTHLQLVNHEKPVVVGVVDTVGIVKTKMDTVVGQVGKVVSYHKLVSVLPEPEDFVEVMQVIVVTIDFLN